MNKLHIKDMQNTTSHRRSSIPVFINNLLTKTLFFPKGHYNRLKDIEHNEKVINPYAKKWAINFFFILLACFLSPTFSYGQWTEIQKALAADGNGGDTFGYSVSISGNVALVGAYQNDDDGFSSGSAYIYRYNGTNWVQEQKITANDAAASDLFGYSVSLSGNVALVGANQDDDKGTNSGSAYLYRYNGTNWVQEQKITATDGASSDFFGNSVSVSGNVALVGANQNDDGGINSGSAYLYRYNGTNWVQEQKITANDAASSDFFGYSVSLSGDVALVGANNNDDSGTNSGSAYLYRYNGTNWTQEQKITANDAAANDLFGYSVSLSNDVALVGANNDDNRGSAYLYRYNGTNWTQEQKITASDGASSDFFGNSVSISNNVALVGAYNDDDNGTNSGSAYLYRYNGTNWTQEEKITATDGATTDLFGYSVSISDNVALVGAYQNDDDGLDSGSAYFYAGPTCNINLAPFTPTCLGSPGSGSISVDVTGSNLRAPYTYSYTGPTSGSGSAATEPFSITGLADGSYDVTVTNAASIQCDGSATVSSVVGSFFEITQVATTNEGGGGGNGDITVFVDGGAPNYTYTWSGASSGNSGAISAKNYNIPNLSAGDYNITITDGGGEVATVMITILNENTTNQCNAAVDVLILNDVSGSVDATEYTQSKRFFTDFASALNVGPGAMDARMGIAEWSSTTTNSSWQIRLPLGSSPAALQTYTGFNRPFSGGTNPQASLTRGYNYMENNARAGVPKVLVIATDASPYQLSNSLITVSKQYQAQGYTVVTIAFDVAFSNGFTRNILDQTSTPGFTYGAPAYAALNNDLANRIVNLQVCTANPGTTNTTSFARDGTMDITGVAPAGVCPNISSVTVDYTVCAQQQLSTPAGMLVSFYNGNPLQAGATYLTTATIPCAIAAGACENLSVDIPLNNGAGNVYAVLNDDGQLSPPLTFPVTNINELSYLNNIDNMLVLGGTCIDAVLVATKTALSPQPVCGDVMIYEVSVCNTSAIDATGVIVTDVFPTGFILTSSVDNLNGCATGGGGTYDIPAGCCILTSYQYDASGAANGTYADQDVTLSGPAGPTYLGFNGAASGLENIEVTGVPFCPSDVVTWTQSPDNTDVCEDAFVTYSFAIDNQTNLPLLNLSFDMTLPTPVIFGAEPYNYNNLSVGPTDITGKSTASFLIASVPANSTATFDVDIYTGDWSAAGNLAANATLGNLPSFANGTGANLITSPTNITINALPDVEAGANQSISENDSATLSGSIANGTIESWTSSGDGTFSDSLSLTPSYTPGPNDILAGFATLSLSANPLSMACFTDLDTLRLTVTLADTDNDGIPDNDDLDDDNDGITDIEENLTASNGGDTDGDGVPDSLDLDSDNDGINDVIEGGGTDDNGDGFADGTVGTGTTTNGIPSTAGPGGEGLDPPNTDGTGAPDFQDLDADDDGISDLVESGDPGATDMNDDGVVDGPDTDGDGIQDPTDGDISNFGDNNSPAPDDNDGDDIPNYIDLDSDDPNNTIGDGNDDVDYSGNGGLDGDNDGKIDPSGDVDNDGINDDIDEDIPVYGGLGAPDTDGDGVPDKDDLDDDNDGITDIVENLTASNGGDTDGDGVPDTLDLDSDNDGINDVIEGGGTDNNDDGIADGIVGTGTTTNGIPSTAGPGGEGLDPPNTDGIGAPNFQDLDSDDDGLSDLVESGDPTAINGDMDNDGVVDGPDSDNDGIQDPTDLAPASFGDNSSPDPDDDDGDGLPNYIDLDSDDSGNTLGDGNDDVDDSGNGGLDGDDDGQIDDPTDVDNDGIVDVIDDKLPIYGGLGTPDTDGDGIPNTEDLDDDNDGITDIVENLTASNGGDTDGDGVPDILDLDSDNDGINDVIEGGGTDGNGDGFADGTVGTGTTTNGIPSSAGPGGEGLDPPNSDGTGAPDFQDLDSDDDGISDLVESGDPGATDMNDDGVVDGPDTDGDGIQDPTDDDISNFGDDNSPAPKNDDGDTLPNYIDLDSDDPNNTIGDNDDDVDDSGNGPSDGNGDGKVDPTGDVDNDGIDDDIDEEVPVYGGLGKPDVLMPDLFPNFTFSNPTFIAGQSKNVVININEISGDPTRGEIQFFVPTSAGFTYAYNPAQTIVTVLAPIAVNNGDWTMTPTGTGLLFTSNTIILGGERSRIALNVTANTAGTKANLTVNITPNSGGETELFNNTAVLSQSIQN